MTLPEFLVVLAFVFLMAFSPQPKKGPKPKKPRKAIPIRGRLKRRAVWRRGRSPTVEQVAFARKCQDDNIMQSRNARPTIALCETLQHLRIRFERETVTWYDGDLFVLSDFTLPDLKITIELDGLHHRHQHINDWEKAKIIKDITGCRTIRFWNAETLKPGFPAKLKAKLGL
jgi:very-short-patch-repair endonuclease